MSYRQVFLSHSVNSSGKVANQLELMLNEKKLTAFNCTGMKAGDVFRDAIIGNASNCKAMVIFMDKQWALSKECEFEFNCALSSFMKNGWPQFVPIVIGGMDWINLEYHSTAHSITSNFQCIVSKDDASDWTEIFEKIATRCEIIVKEHEKMMKAKLVVQDLWSSRKVEFSEELKRWFAFHKIHAECQKALINNGFDDMELVLELTTEDIEGLGLKDGHKKRLCKSLKASDKKSAEKKSSTIRPCDKIFPLSTESELSQFLRTGGFPEQAKVEMIAILFEQDSAEKKQSGITSNRPLITVLSLSTESQTPQTFLAEEFFIGVPDCKAKVRKTAKTIFVLKEDSA